MLPTSAAPIASSIPPPGPKILLIDDEENLVFGLTSIMRRAGYEVLAATDGANGLCLAQEQKPDLIICDVMMPTPNGFELRKILSLWPDMASIPFIFLTARTGGTDKLRGLKSGADDYMTKPFNRDELLARVEAVLRRNELGRQKGLAEAQTQIETLKREVSQNISHELRTPVGLVLMSLEMALKERFAGKLLEQDLFIKMALESAQRLHTLIDDLITLGEMDRGQLNTVRQSIRLEFDFHLPIKQRLECWAPKQLEVRLAVAPDLTITAPAAGFKRAIAHLVDNACKFSPAGGRVDIELAANGLDGCTFTASNEGDGIPAELRERVFERYFQISRGVNRLHGGLGVGLAIARAIARGLGGDVVILDSDAGCRVQMTIPPAQLDGEAADDPSTDS